MRSDAAPGWSATYDRKTSLIFEIGRDKETKNDTMSFKHMANIPVHKSLIDAIEISAFVINITLRSRSADADG